VPVTNIFMVEKDYTDFKKDCADFKRDYTD